MKCEEKKKYSHAQALAMKRRREHENKTLQLRPYYCNRCGFWHLTSREDIFKPEKEVA